MEWVLLAIVVAVVLYGVVTYNGLVSLRQRVTQAFADIDVQLKQRHDLIPNLVETVKATPAMSAARSRRWCRPATPR